MNTLLASTSVMVRCTGAVKIDFGADIREQTQPFAFLASLTLTHGDGRGQATTPIPLEDSCTEALSAKMLGLKDVSLLEAPGVTGDAKFTSVRVLILTNLSSSDGPSLLFGGHPTPFLGPATVSDVLEVPPGGVIVWIAPGGWDVTAANAGVRLRSTAGEAPYRLLVLGVSHDPVLEQ